MPKYTLEQRLQKIKEFKEDLREVRKWERELVNKINRNRRALPGGKYMKPLKSVRTQVIPEPRSYVKSFTSKRERFLTDRNKLIIDLWNSDPLQTLNSVGLQFNITRERIRQVLKKAKLHGIEIRPSSDRSKHLKTKQIEVVKAEVFDALKNIYGTLEFPVWKKQFLKKSTPTQTKFLRKEMRRRWKNGTLDPLFNFEVDISLKEKHFKILQYRKWGMTLDDIGMILNLSKPSITNYLKDLKLAGLYTNVNESQVEATSLDDDLVEERLNKVREALIAGQHLHNIKVIGYEGDAAHFIRWHFLKPYFHNQNKKTEQANGSLNEKMHSS